VGTAQALPGVNTVDSGDIIDGQVQRADIDGGAVTSAKVANGSLTGGDIANNSLTGADINESTLALGSFARVGDDGTQAVLVASRGVTSVSLSGTTSWPEYLITFDDPVATCGWTVSINPFFGGPPNGYGVPTVGLNWDNTQPETQVPDPHVLRVKLTGYDEDGIIFGARIGGVETFTVAAHC
jgi:hypothetical protein